MTIGETPRVIKRVVGPLQTNCFILHCLDTKEAIIVDPGGDPDLIEATIEELKLKPIMIVSTHGHSDHIAGVKALKRRFSIPYALHPADEEIVKLSVREAPLWGMGEIEEPEIDRFLNEGDTITFGKISGSIIHTPGHTPGGICISFNGLVIVGDTLFYRSVGRTDLYGGNTGELLNSIKNKLFTLPDETEVLCGHGPETRIGEEKEKNPFLEMYNEL